MLIALAVTNCGPTTAPSYSTETHQRAASLRTANSGNEVETPDPPVRDQPIGQLADPFAPEPTTGKLVDPFASPSHEVEAQTTNETPSREPRCRLQDDDLDFAILRSCVSAAIGECQRLLDDGDASLTLECWKQLHWDELGPQHPDTMPEAVERCLGNLQQQLHREATCLTLPETDDEDVLAKFQCFTGMSALDLGPYPEAYWTVSYGRSFTDRAAPHAPKCGRLTTEAFVRAHQERLQIEPARSRVVAAAEPLAERHGIRRATCKVHDDIARFKTTIKVGSAQRSRHKSKYVRASWQRTKSELKSGLAQLTETVLPARRKRFKTIWRRDFKPMKDCASR